MRCIVWCSIRKKLGDMEQKLASIVAELVAERKESAHWKQRALQQQKTLQVQLSSHVYQCIYSHDRCMDVLCMIPYDALLTTADKNFARLTRLNCTSDSLTSRLHVGVACSVDGSRELLDSGTVQRTVVWARDGAVEVREQAASD